MPKSKIKSPNPPENLTHFGWLGPAQEYSKPTLDFYVSSLPWRRTTGGWPTDRTTIQPEQCISRKNHRATIGHHQRKHHPYTTHLFRKLTEPLGNDWCIQQCNRPPTMSRPPDPPSHRPRTEKPKRKTGGGAKTWTKHDWEGECRR